MLSLFLSTSFRVFPALFASSYLLISADITTTDDADRNIKLYAEDNVEIRIGLRVKLKADLTIIDEF